MQFLCRWETKDAERIRAESTAAVVALELIRRLHLRLSPRLHGWELRLNLEALNWIQLSFPQHFCTPGKAQHSSYFSGPIATELTHTDLSPGALI